MARQERYRRNLRFYADDPAIRVGGPTYHWVREGIHAGRNIISQVDKITTTRMTRRRHRGTKKVLRTIVDHPIIAGL